MLLAFSTAFAAGVAEFVVRAFIPVRNVGPSFTTYDPVYGKWLKRGASVERVTPEFTMRFSTNADGYRQQAMLPPRSHPVLYLGDSFTMGYGVNDGEEYVALLQKALPNVPMLNGGMGDNGNGRWVKILRHLAPSYEPRLVVMQVMANDFEDNNREALFELVGQELVERPVAAPGALRAAQELIEAAPLLSRSHLVGLLRQLRFGVPVPARVDEATAPPASDELTYRVLEAALSICQRHGWPVLAVLVEIDGPRLERLQALFRSRQVTIVQAPAKKVRPDLYYRVDGHWNASGHRHVAERLLPAIARHVGRQALH
jgi:lysophospholipase L1-like esterase